MGPRDFQGGRGLKPIMDRWNSFLRLSGFERGVAIEALAGLAATWVGLRLAGFRHWKNALEWLAPRATRSEARATNASLAECAQVIARMQAAAARNLFFTTNCLEQSLVLWWLLRLRGIASELRVGARKDSGRLCPRCSRPRSCSWSLASIIAECSERPGPWLEILTP